MKNRKIILTILLVLSVLCLTSCLSTMLTSFISNTKVDIPFSGTMDPCFGYENLSWGTSYNAIKDAGYPLTKPETENNFTVSIGKSERLYNEYSGKYYNSHTRYGHGDVNRTDFEFVNNKLFAVYDEFLTTPSMEYLHQRYGNFSEENVVFDVLIEKGITELYTNYKCGTIPNTLTLEIYVFSNGQTSVKVYDEFTSFSKSFPIVEILDRNYGSADVKTKVQPNKWNCYASLDSKNKKIDYTFVNQNSDGKYLFIGYSKDYSNPVLSYVRSGICWRNSTYGSYEIKIGSNITPRQFSSSDWYSAYNDTKYTYTRNSGESAREMVNLFLENEKITVRHSNTVSEFICNAKDLQTVMSKAGVTLDELDAAMANEEF